MDNSGSSPRTRLLSLARQAVDARLRGLSQVTLGDRYKQVLLLDEPGMCNRFVRQMHELALGLRPHTWPYRGATAAETLRKLEPYRIPLSERRPGDILGFATPKPDDAEHIAIYMGYEFDPSKELVAENTSETRGYPRRRGTKVTRYDTLRRRITGCYRVLP